MGAKKMMKIVCDENIPLAEHYFASLGEISFYPGREISAEYVRDADVLLVRSITKVDERLLKGSRISFVGTATIGEDHIDKRYLRQAGIGFSSAPGCNANSVAEYVLAALFDWWENPEIVKSVSSLDQLSVGIVGAGNVGARVKLLCDALGICAFCYDPLKPEWAHIQFEDLRTADVVSFHTPLTHGGPFPTYHLADQAFIESLKPGALLLNSGRGAVVDNAALIDALQRGQRLHVCLDVWEAEPNINCELAAACYLATPHIAGYSYDGKVAGTRMLYQALCQHLSLESPPQSSSEVARIDIPQSKLIASKSAIAACIRHAYSIREDDAGLRALLATVTGASELSEGFDALRKSYRKRREFSCYTFSRDGLVLRDQAHLEKIGFLPK
mgnify:CR=1 FL=1